MRAASYAAGRWGHVMFPENAHDAAIAAAQALLTGAGRSWGTRVFYSDNGSTAMEIAVKMAIRAYYVRKAGHVVCSHSLTRSLAQVGIFERHLNYAFNYLKPSV